MRTTAQRKKLHKELWTWLTKNPDKRKLEWLGFKEIKPPIAHCFACEEVHGNCLKCPIGKICNNNFDKWTFSTNLKTRSRLALKIANAWR